MQKKKKTKMFENSFENDILKTVLKTEISESNGIALRMTNKERPEFISSPIPEKQGLAS